MKLNIEGDLMRRVIAVLAAVAALVVPSSASATPSASVSPSSVDFGRVHYNGGCSVVADIPNEFCVTQTLTITNTGTETLRGSGAKACERYVAESNGCFTLHASWGGFVSAGDPNTCLFHEVEPGDSCTVVLVAFPSRPGRIRGFFVAEMATLPLTDSVTTILVVPIQLLGVPA
jgi:hypothetical protein